MSKNRLAALLLVLSSTLFAEVSDKWKVNLGGMFVTNFETDMQVGKKDVPVGVKINTKDQLGLDSQTAAFRLDGYYRFTDYHSIDVSYFSVRSDGNRYVDHEFQWNGDTLSDINVNSHFDMDIYKINYGYSFYHNKDIELMLTAGLHITAVDLGIEASGIVNGEASKKVSSGASVAAPLPVVGFKGEYTIIPKSLFVNYKAEYFYLAFDVYKGAFVSSILSFEYRFLDNFGIGLGFTNNTILAEMEDGDKKVEIENQLTGVTTYLTYIY